MKAVKSRVDDWPVTHPVIRAALLEEDVCPDCGQDMQTPQCPRCHALHRPSRATVYHGTTTTIIG